jgi:thiol:disulfide interchange protein DsbA
MFSAAMRQFAFVLLSLLIPAAAIAQVNPVMGKDYTLLNPTQPTDSEGQVEVLEFFSYGCIHCFHLESALGAWEKKLPKDVKVKRVPTDFKIKGFDSRPVFYALEAMGMLDKLHYKLFEAFHKDNVTLGNPDVLAQWLAREGVDMKKYQEIEKSFSVQSKVNRARILQSSYKIEATPTLALNGKYLIPSQEPALLFPLVDSLIATLRTGAKPPAGKS